MHVLDIAGLAERPEVDRIVLGRDKGDHGSGANVGDGPLANSRRLDWM